MENTECTLGVERRAPKSAHCVCGILPPYILDRLAEADDTKIREAAEKTLTIDAMFREKRKEAPREVQGAAPVGPAVLQRSIFDTHNTRKQPGDLVRSEGEDPVLDGTVNRAYDALGLTFAFFEEAYGRRSIDDANLPLDATIHFGRKFNNAFWDGEAMVFGDGDGLVWNDFTLDRAVVAHELMHGVTQYTADLVYEDQSGALNESMSDVFGSLVKQFSRQQTAEDADWLIGAGLFTPAVRGQALRSLKAPGTAFDDRLLGGRDPQPDHMDNFVETDQDEGGVHINSGIPNRAFFLVATALGGFAWERAGQIWYDTLLSGELSKRATFKEFAQATVAATKRRFGQGSELEAVLKAWAHVGVNGNNNG
ncbi:M4 family metallopeptidase [Streptomyces sp. NPDC091371]|uniref:M4 family metallopeptidase n=1 Tax=Streptomyces sp. NPDC091371 TaxID=3155303 RepID=UPI003414F690